MVNKLNSFVGRLGAGAIVVALTSAAHAFQFAPLRTVLKSSGASTKQTYEIKNTKGTPLPVQITVSHWAFDEAGVEVDGELADDLFLVYPSELLVPPGGSSTVRLRWVGGPALETTRVFRIVAEELVLPMKVKGDVTEPRGRIQTKLRYKGMIEVVKPDGKPDLRFLAGDLDEDGMLTLLFENVGDGLGTPALNRLTMTDARGKDLDLASSKFGRIIGAIPPGARRSYEIKNVEDGELAPPVAVSVDLVAGDVR